MLVWRWESSAMNSSNDKRRVCAFRRSWKRRGVRLDIPMEMILSKNLRRRVKGKKRNTSIRMTLLTTISLQVFLLLIPMLLLLILREIRPIIIIIIIIFSVRFLRNSVMRTCWGASCWKRRSCDDTRKKRTMKMRLLMSSLRKRMKWFLSWSNPAVTPAKRKITTIITLLEAMINLKLNSTLVIQLWQMWLMLKNQRLSMKWNKN